MNIESMANYADVIAGIAVIVSLIYVGVQIRRNTKSSLSQTNQAAHESMANVSLEVAKNQDLAVFFRRGLIAFDQLTDDEEFQFLLLMVTVFRRFENIFYQHNKGLLEDDLWEGYKQSNLIYFFTDGGQAFWKQRQHTFSENYRNFLDSASSNQIKSTPVK